MRRIFPLKSVAAGGSSNQHGQQHGGAGGSGAAAVPKKENNSRMKGTPVASRYAPELSKKSVGARSKRADASSSAEDTSFNNGRANHGGGGGGGSRREHWCPACPPAPENGARCDTPPSGDENTESKEVEKGVISCPPSVVVDPPHRARSRRPSVDLDSASRDHQQLDKIVTGFDSSVVEAMKGRDRVSSVNSKYASKRSGLGVVDNLVHDRHSGKPPAKTKQSTAAAARQEQSSRSTSVPKSRQAPRAATISEPLRLNSMRILKVPDRVFETTSHSSVDSTRVSDASSSTGSPTPRSATAGARERERLLIAAAPLTRPHSRAHSFSEGSSAHRPPPGSPSSAGRKPIDSPRSSNNSRKGDSVPLSAIPSAPEAAAGIAKGHNSKYSGARVVAERLAKAFRGTGKAKDGKSLSLDGERRTKLGQSKKMTAVSAVEEVADSSYDGSCSDTTSLQTVDEGVTLTNVLQLARPGNAPSSQHSRKDSSGSTGTTGESALSWQEFVNDPRAPQGVSLIDHPTPESSSVSSQQISKNSGGTITGSRHWGTATAANEGNMSPGRKLLYSPSRQQEKVGSRQEKEREVLKGWLEGLKRQSEGMTDDLDMKSRMADQRISALSGEQSFEAQDILQDFRALDEDTNSNIVAGINIMQQRIKRMHEEKKRLALEVAAEVKRRITERAAAKEVLVMMKREMEACVRVMEKENVGIQAGFERELERRENEWQKKFDNVKQEEKWLRERVRRLEDERGGLKTELAAAVLKQGGLREKVGEFESQMEGHRKRVEGAEKTILDLRQSLLSSCQQAKQAESELENVRSAYVEKENQSQEHAKQVARLQQLCTNHETSIEGLQRGLKEGSSVSNDHALDSFRMELVRLSTVEKMLREELEALRSETISLEGENKDLVERLGRERSNRVNALDHNLQAELVKLQMQIAELEEENRVLSTNLQHAEEERDSGRKVLQTLESSMENVEVNGKALEEEVERERGKVQEKEREIHRLERRVDGLLKNNQMLQGILAMREKAALMSDEEVKEKEKAVMEAHQLEAEMRDSLQVSARQLAFMNERAELMSEKLKERDGQLTALKSDSGKKDEVIRGLEQSLSDLARSMDAQNRRIVHLTGKNGDLSRHLQARAKEVEDLHSKIVVDSQGRITCNEEIDQISVQAHDVNQELEAQNLLCKLLRDKLAQSEDDLSKRNEEVAGLIRSRDWFQSELQRAQSSLGEASHRLATLERIINQKEEIISSWKAEKQGYLQDIVKLRETLPQVERERDEMREEADEIGREALRVSAEVEVLRRKVAQLEEDVLVKEGQISILRGSCFGGSE